MPPDTGMDATRFLTLSLRASISNGCRNTDLLLQDTRLPGRSRAQATPSVPAVLADPLSGGAPAEGGRPERQAGEREAQHDPEIRPHVAADTAEGLTAAHRD